MVDSTPRRSLGAERSPRVKKWRKRGPLEKRRCLTTYFIPLSCGTRAISDETRYALLQVIYCDQQIAVGELWAQSAVSAATVAHHTKILNDAGLIQVKRRGRSRLLVAQRNRWETRGQLFKTFSHCVRAFGTRRSWTHRIDADTLGAIFSRPGFGQKIDGGLARTIEAHPRCPVIGSHGRDIDRSLFYLASPSGGQFPRQGNTAP